MLSAGAKLPKLARRRRPEGQPDRRRRPRCRPSSTSSPRSSETAGTTAFGGIFHATGSGETTWHGLAVATFEEARRHDGPSPEVEAIATADWPTPAQRPADSRLDNAKLAETFGVTLPPWRDSLARTVDSLLG